MTSDALSISILATLCLGVLASVLTAMLRIGGVGHGSVGPGGYRGTAIVGGIVAGLLAGPSVLGRVAPGTYREAFVGGVAETEAFREVAARQRADIMALRAMDVTEIAIREQMDQHEAELAPLREAIARAEGERREVFDAIAVGIASVCLLVAGSNCGRGDRRRKIPLRAALRGGVAAHLAGVALPSMVFVAFGVGDVWGSLAFGLVIGAFGVSGTLRGIERGIASVSLLLACAVAGFHLQGWLAAALPLAFACGVLVSRLRRRSVRRSALSVSRWAALPMLAAVLASRVDVAALGPHTNFWFLFFASVLWCSDGRWFAAWAALRVAGEGDAGWTRAARLVNAGTGTLMLVLTAYFASVGIAGEAFIASALAGAAVVELFRGFREFAGPVLDETGHTR